MTEQQYLNELELALHQLKREELQDILRDFREYFSSGRQEGKTDEEIASSLGAPDYIATELLKAYSEEDMIVTEEQPQGEKFSKVVIEVDRAELHIEPSHDEKAYADLKEHGLYTTLDMDIVGDTLKIRVKEHKKFFVFGFIIQKLPVVKVQLPKRLYDLVRVTNDNGTTTITQIRSVIMDVQSDNGRIELQDLDSINVKLKTDNGRIQANELQSRMLEVETDNGRIDLSYVTAEQIRANTDNGRIELVRVSGKIEAETDNGRIECYIPTIDKPITLETDNGAIQLWTDHKPENATIQAKKDWGKINIFGEKTKQMVLGNGEIPIYLKTDNGSIIVSEK